MMQPERPTFEDTSSLDELSQEQLNQLLNGLAYGQVPLREATQEVTQRYRLGPRGTWILSLITWGHRYPSDLSRLLQASPSLITAELGHLTKAGLITASPDPADRRRSELSITPEGLSACQQVRRELHSILRRNLRHYTTEEVLFFIRMLRDVRASHTRPDYRQAGQGSAIE